MPFFGLAMPCVLWCNLFEACGRGWDEIHESFSFYLVDDIFWHSGFKSAEHAEKVMSQIINYCDYCNYCDYFHYFRLEWIMAFLRAYGRINATPLQRDWWSGCRIPSDFAWWLGPLPLAEKFCWRTGAKCSAGRNRYERQDSSTCQVSDCVILVFSRKSTFFSQDLKFCVISTVLYLKNCVLYIVLLCLCKMSMSSVIDAAMM